MTKTIDLEAVSRSSDLVVKHIGYRDDELRIVFKEAESGKPVYTIEMHGICKYGDSGVIKAGVVVVNCRPELGSFGWDIPSADRPRYRELHLTSKTDVTRNYVRAIVEQVVFRPVDRADVDINFPG